MAVVALSAATAVLALPSPAGAEAPWQAAEQVRASLFDAQRALILDDPQGGFVPARKSLEQTLAPSLKRSDPRSVSDIRSAFADGLRAAPTGDEIALARARGEITAALRTGALAVVLDAVAREDIRTARQWLLIRDFREATRFTRPGVDATAALEALEAGEVSSEAAATQIEKDLLDAYQARLGGFLEDTVAERERGFEAAAAESAALVAGYWRILAPEFEAQRGAAERQAVGADFAAFRRAAEGSVTDAKFDPRVDAIKGDLDGFTAAPFTAEEQARRANQLIRFLDLVPIEYDDGTDDGRVTIPFEIQEAVAFLEGAQSAFDDLQPALEERNPAGVDAVQAAFDELRTYTDDANEGGTVVSLEQVEAAHERASAELESLFPEQWKESSDEADFDLIEISLDQMQAAISANERLQAEQDRLSAYAFFEFGPEIKLRAFDPRLVAEVEGLMWYGANGTDGLAELIASDAPASEIRETRLVLDEALDDARATTGEGASDATVITNAAVIVFREGLEAILILAAITASMVGANRPLRRPVLRGALFAIPASVLLWIGAQFLLDSLSQYGEKLEAVVGVVAIGVLLLVMNWFFHRVYWTEWIAGHRKRGKRLAAGAAGAAGIAAGTVAGLYVLGFTSIFREGFEIVLFLQALQLSSGTGVVLAGVSLGLAVTALVGYVTFKLEQRLPYKRMLVVTGVLIAFVLVVLVGNTARTLQGVGWLPITPVEIEFHLWLGTWLGVYPTVETLAAQAGAFTFVIGSYFLAGWVSKRRRRESVAPENSTGGRNGHREGHGLDHRVLVRNRARDGARPGA